MDYIKVGQMTQEIKDIERRIYTMERDIEMIQKGERMQGFLEIDFGRSKRRDASRYYPSNETVLAIITSALSEAQTNLKSLKEERERLSRD